jgi:hypothetical protein
MQVAVRHFMPQILRHVMIAPMGVHDEPRIRLQKKRPSRWHRRKVPLQKLGVTLAIGKQMDVDDFVASGQSKRAADVFTLRYQVTHDAMVLRQLKIAMDLQLADPHVVRIRKRNRLRQPAATAKQRNNDYKFE